MVLVVLQLAALVFYHTDSLQKRPLNPHSGEYSLPCNSSGSLDRNPPHHERCHSCFWQQYSLQLRSGSACAEIYMRPPILRASSPFTCNLTVRAAGDNARDSAELSELVSADLTDYSLATFAVLALTLSTLVVSHHTHSAQSATRQQPRQRRQLSVSHSSNLLSRPVCPHSVLL